MSGPNTMARVNSWKAYYGSKMGTPNYDNVRAYSEFPLPTTPAEECWNHLIRTPDLVAMAVSCNGAIKLLHQFHIDGRTLLVEGVRHVWAMVGHGAQASPVVVPRELMDESVISMTPSWTNLAAAAHERDVATMNPEDPANEDAYTLERKRFIILPPFLSKALMDSECDNPATLCLVAIRAILDFDRAISGSSTNAPVQVTAVTLFQDVVFALWLASRNSWPRFHFDVLSLTRATDWCQRLQNRVIDQEVTHIPATSLVTPLHVEANEIVLQAEALGFALRRLEGRPRVYNRVSTMWERIQVGAMTLRCGGAMSLQRGAMSLRRAAIWQYESMTVPPMESRARWVMDHALDFFNDVSMIWEVVGTEPYLNSLDPGEGFPPAVLHPWSDGGEAISVSATQYVHECLAWLLNQFNDEARFPGDGNTEEETLWVFETPQYSEFCRQIFCRLFRMYGILSSGVFLRTLEALDMAPHLRDSFEAFLFFCFQFHLLPNREMEPLDDLVRPIRNKYESPFPHIRHHPPDTIEEKKLDIEALGEVIPTLQHHNAKRLLVALKLQLEAELAELENNET